MPSVAVYRFHEMGDSHVRSREVSAADADSVLEAETADSERRLGRTRVPYCNDSGEAGFKIGDGNDPAYELVMLERY